jgi:hypothetical protein
MRVEADGVTLAQITFEAERVRALETSAAGALVYLVGTGENATLVYLDGSGRREIATGPISMPRLSPDGEQVLYRLDDPTPGLIVGQEVSPSGVWLQATAGTRPSLVRADVPLTGEWDPGAPAWRYEPVGWAPDGSRFALFAFDAAGPAIPGGDVVILTVGSDDEVRGPSCCEEERWSADGRSLSVAGGGPGPDVRYGLFQIDAATGAETAILEQDGRNTPLVSAPQQLADGRIYTFVELVPTDVVDWEYPYTPALAQVAPDGAITPLRPADLTPFEVLWDTQAGGAVISFDVTLTADEVYAGPLAWLAVGASEPLVLPLSGSALRWASSVPLAEGDCTRFAPLGFQPTATRSFDANVRDLQARLNAQGFDSGPADGFFGEQTRAAVEAFQAAQGLPVTGELDCRSWQALLDSR